MIALPEFLMLTCLFGMLALLEAADGAASATGLFATATSAAASSGKGDGSILAES